MTNSKLQGTRRIWDINSTVARTRDGSRSNLYDGFHVDVELTVTTERHGTKFQRARSKHNDTSIFEGSVLIRCRLACKQIHLSLSEFIGGLSDFTSRYF